MPEDVELLSAEVKTLSFNLESYKKSNDECNLDMQVHLNDVSEQLDTIQNNHLAHLKTDIKWLKWTVGIGLAFIALLNGILGAIIAYSVVFNG